MDSLDSMFVPYKDLLYPKAEPPKPTTSWLWIGLVIVIGSVIAYFLFFKDSKKSFASLLPTVHQETPIIDLKSLPSVKNSSIDLKSVSNIIPTPPLKDIPKTINLIRGGQKEVYASPTEFARQVGTAVKETLVTFPQMNAPLVASIVQCAIKSVLGSQKEKEPETKPQPTVAPVINIAPPVEPPSKPKEGKLSVVSLPLPIVDDEEIEADSGKKQTKINADSNPYVLKMLKDRGLDKKE